MKKKTEDIAKGKDPGLNGDRRMTRKEAIKKTGYIAVSAATMMILLSNPAKAQVASTPTPPPGWVP